MTFDSFSEAYFGPKHDRIMSDRDEQIARDAWNNALFAAEQTVVRRAATGPRVVAIHSLRCEPVNLVRPFNSMAWWKR